MPYLRPPHFSDANLAPPPPSTSIGGTIQATATRRGRPTCCPTRSPLLHKLDKLGTGTDTMLKIELEAILDTICGELDASDVAHEAMSCGPGSLMVPKS